MTKYYFIALLLSTFYVGFSQEVCNNNYDDDGNGLSDCDDGTCASCVVSDDCSNYSFRKFANSGSGRNYSSATRALTSNDSYMLIANLNAGHATNFQSRVFTFTGLGFDIPSNAIINGIKVVMERSATAGGTIFDSQMQLYDGITSSVIGNDVATTATHFWPDSLGGVEETFVYGSSGSTWGAALTPNMINDGGFGIQFRVESATNTTNQRALIDHLYLEVCYSYGAEICNNGIDDNNDGLNDCDDAECPACVGVERCFTKLGKSSVSNSGAGFAVVQNVTRVQVADNVFANINNVSSSGTNISENLDVMGFAHNVPLSSTIVGVEMDIRRSVQVNGSLQDAQIQLIYNGGVIGNNISTSKFWQRDTTVVKFGSSNDLWGASLTPAIVNDSSFGVRLVVNNTNYGSSADGRIDYISLKVCTDLSPEICNNNLDDDLDGFQDEYDTIDCPCDDANYFNACASSCSYIPVPEPYVPETTWIGQNVDARETTLVGDVDNDDTTEVIFDDYGNPGIIYILSGRDGTTKYTINTGLDLTQNNSCNGIADTDGDGYAEIYVVDATRNLARFDFNGVSWGLTWLTTGTQIDDNEAMPHFADFDGDGNAEVYCNDAIFDAATGNFLCESSNGISSATTTFAIDILEWDLTTCPDCDGAELIAGGRIYGVDLVNMTVTQRVRVDASVTDIVGPTSVADVDLDGDLDVVYTASLNNGTANVGHLVVYDGQTSNLLMPVYEVPAGLSGSQAGGTGRVNIADFDGDGELEFGFCGKEIYVVVDDINVASAPQSLWSLLTTDGSAITGSTVYDFEADGASEVIYRDEDTLFVLNGVDGSPLFKARCTSGTRYEYPVVADVNDDGQTEICVACNNSGVTAFTSANAPWVVSRDSWNQHGYNTTNINDDLTVPAAPANNAQVGGGVFNNFLAQSTPVTETGAAVIPVANLIPRVYGIDYTKCDTEVTVKIEVTNIGSNNVPVVDLSLYSQDPETSAVGYLTTIQTPGIIAAGSKDSVEVTLSYTAAFTIFIMANDPGTITRPYDIATDFPATSVAECNFQDNKTSQFVDCVSMPLPIELISFSAHLNGDRVDLYWETASELNNDYFIVERSKDGLNWEIVVEVDGAGNSTYYLEYFDVDYSPLDGKSYYRLKQVDFDGAYSISKVVPVYNPGSNEIGVNLFPNPAGPSEVNISLSGLKGMDVLVVVRDVQGKEFVRMVNVVESDNVIVAIPRDRPLAAGVYLVTASAQNMIYSKKLVVK